MTEHTPGPWTKTPDKYEVVGGGTRVALMHGEVTKADANADRIVECVNAMEPGGKVEALLDTVEYIAGRLEAEPAPVLHGGKPMVERRLVQHFARKLRAALEPFNRED